METTLFNQHGHPVAYVAADGDNSIYLWSGHAVDYIYQMKVYGWNGQHLGWFLDGVIYNLNGYRIGSVREKCPSATYAEPAKYAKYAKYTKQARYAAYARPTLTTSYSDETLENFLKRGAVGSI